MDEVSKWIALASAATVTMTNNVVVAACIVLILLHVKLRCLWQLSFLLFILSKWREKVVLLLLTCRLIKIHLNFLLTRWWWWRKKHWFLELNAIIHHNPKEILLLDQVFLQCWLLIIYWHPSQCSLQIVYIRGNVVCCLDSTFEVDYVVLRRHLHWTGVAIGKLDNQLDASHGCVPWSLAHL